MFARTLGDGIEGADVLDFIAEKIETVRLIGRDRVDVDNASADGVVAGGFADCLCVVVERTQGFEQGVERLGLAAFEGEFTR